MSGVSFFGAPALRETLLLSLRFSRQYQGLRPWIPRGLLRALDPRVQRRGADASEGAVVEQVLSVTDADVGFAAGGLRDFAGLGGAVVSGFEAAEGLSVVVGEHFVDGEGFAAAAASFVYECAIGVGCARLEFLNCAGRRKSVGCSFFADEASQQEDSENGRDTCGENGEREFLPELHFFSFIRFSIRFTIRFA